MSAISFHSDFASKVFVPQERGIFSASTTDLFLGAIEDLKSRGAECVILGCTEIPLIVSPENSTLATLDSTILLAKYAVLEAISERPIKIKAGWLTIET